jgi:hypothetical protein
MTIERRFRLQIVRYGIDVRELCALIHGTATVVPASSKVRDEFAFVPGINAIRPKIRDRTGSEHDVHFLIQDGA